MFSYLSANENTTIALANMLAIACTPPLCLWLCGDLGAGKTTFARGLLRAFGVTGTIKSPTYTLVEHYHVDQMEIYHFDLYRLHNPLELEELGWREYFSPNALILIEWPERAQNLLPKPDLTCYIRPNNDERLITLEAHTPVALKLLAGLDAS